MATHVRLRTLGVVLAAHAFVALIMLAPITNYRHLDTATYGSDTRLAVWILAWINHAMLDGASLFDANVFYPARNTLAYAEHLLGVSVFTLPVYALTRNPALAYNVVWVLSYVLCGLATQALAWRITRDHLASFVGAVAYTYCFYRMLHGHAHIQLLWACWTPLSLLILERWWRRPSWSLLLVLWIVVLLQVLTSWYLAVMVLVADVPLVLWLAWRLPARRALWPGIATQLAAAVAAGAAVVWPVARHYSFLVEFNGQTRAEAVGNSVALRDLIVPPLNTWLGEWLVHHGSSAPSWIWGEKTLFLGYVTIALAAIGATRLRPPHEIERAGTGSEAPAGWLGYFALLAAVSLALAFGPSARAVATNSFDPSPFGLLTMAPGLALFRVPARFVQLTTLALAVLAAAGAQALHSRFGMRGRAVTLLLIPLMLGEWYIVQFPGGVPQPEHVPAVYRQLAGIPVRAVVSLPDYVGSPEWFRESDYQYYSTAHWRPILNGYARTEPPGYRDRMERIATFPSRDCAEALREAAGDYVVFHAGRYADHGRQRLEMALSSDDFSLVGQAGLDYLFHVNQPTADGTARPASSVR
jgi:hypothetical protein